MFALGKISDRLLLGLTATRPQFFSVIVLPIVLGTAIAWREQGIFLPGWFALALLGGVLAHAGANVLNDYFDHLNHADTLNTAPLTPFAGGSRLIQNHLLTPQATARYGLSLLLAAGLIGLYLSWARGLPLLFIGLAGGLSAYFYSAPPLALHSRGGGEALVGLNFGVLAVLGAYYAQAQHFNGGALAASMPLALLVTAILYINEFPDYASDRQAGKRTLVVRLDRETARRLFLILILSSFVVLPPAIALGLLPWPTAWALLSLPWGVLAVQALYRAGDDTRALLPAIKYTIVLHSVFSICLIFGFIA